MVGGTEQPLTKKTRKGMRTIKIDKSLTLQYFPKWDSEDLPKYARIDKVTGTRHWCWEKYDVEYAMTTYRRKYYEYVKIRWIEDDN